MTDPRAPGSDPRVLSDAEFSDWLKERLLEADTVARRASNIATFGLADRGEAAFNAMFGHGQGNWGQRYRAAMDGQQARNVYDHAHRPIAEGAGTALGIGLTAADAGILGAESAAALPIRTKGLLGEGLSAVKTIAHGDWPVAFQARKIMQNGKATVLDHETAKGLYVEAKFGPHARLTENQKYALRQWGPEGYRVDRWGPRHIGYGAGAVGAGGGLLSAWLQGEPEQDGQ